MTTPPPAKRSQWPVAILLAAAGLLVMALRLHQGELWVAPDSAGYLTLAIGFAERGDWSNPLLLFRLPGYPLLLAAVFAVCGEHAALALRFVQHGMVAGCAGFAVLIALRLGVGRRLSVAAGLVTLANPYLAGYADAVLTEAPYALLLCAWTWLQIVHVQTGRLRSLAAASMVAAGLAVLKDAGQALLFIGVIAGGSTALLRSVRTRAPRAVTCRRVLASGIAGLAPAMLLFGPLLLHNQQEFAHRGLNCNGGMLPYYRGACVERLDSPDSPAVAQVKDLLARAQREGIVAADATMHDYLPTVRAVQHALDPENRQTFVSCKLPQVADLLGDAGWDIVRAHPWTIGWGTVRHARHLLLTPDRAAHDARGQNTAFVVRRVGADALGRYLPGVNGIAEGTVTSGAVNRWLRRLIETPLPLIGISPFALLVISAVLGGATALVRGPRGPALLLILVAAYHVGGAAFMGGLEPRYVVPVHPLFGVWGAYLAGAVCRWVHASAYAALAGSTGAGVPAGRS